MGGEPDDLARPPVVAELTWWLMARRLMNRSSTAG